MARSLTDAEARVIGVLLAGTPGLERERLRVAAVPRSTFHAARRRAYAEEWVIDRYVPDPPYLGRPRATFLLLRPYADHLAHASETLASNSDNVLLWTSGQLVLGVYLHSSAGSARALADTVRESQSASWSFHVDAELDGPAVPVYFDYEGLWSHLVGLPGTAGYPRGLGGTPRPVGDDLAGKPSATGWAASGLIRRPFEAALQGKGGHLVGPFGLPWAQQKLLRAGHIAHRVFLHPGRSPPYQGRGADQVVFVTGSLVPGARPENLFSRLTRESRVFPFLYAADREHVLLGALGRPPGIAGSDVEREERAPVLPILGESLRGIEIVQDVAANVSAPVDHRYDRLLESTSRLA